MWQYISRLWSKQPKKPVFQLSTSADSGYYATQFVDHQAADTRLFVRWSHRAPDLQASPVAQATGTQLLVRLLVQDPAMLSLGVEWLHAMGNYFDYSRVDVGKRLFAQDEQGDFILLVLDGSVAEDRLQPSGQKVRLGEMRVGDVLGELSMLDGGTRLGTCVALTPVTVGVLSSHSLSRLLAEEPRLGAELALWLGKRLSLRLRQMSARLSVQLVRADTH